MLRVLFGGTGWTDFVPCLQEALRSEGIAAEVLARDPARPLHEQLRDVQVALPSNSAFGPRELDAAPALRLIQQPAVGYEGIDLAATRERSIPVCNAPGMNTDAVAQAALLLVLALARRLPLARRAFEAATIGAPLGRELTGKTAVVVGVGATGARFADLARALRMTVTGVRRADGRAGLLRALARADVVSVHCPLTAATRKLFDDEAFAAMAPGALFVNVARGGIVDRAALEGALAAGRLGGVGLDVFWDEPWDPEDPLFARDDVVTLPHVAGSTREAFERIAAVAARNVRAVVHGGALAHRVDR